MVSVGKSQQRALKKFWQWWSKRGADLALQELESGRFNAFPKEVAGWLQALEPRLRWELGPGTTVAAISFASVAVAILNSAP